MVKDSTLRWNFPQRSKVAYIQICSPIIIDSCDQHIYFDLLILQLHDITAKMTFSFSHLFISLLGYLISSVASTPTNVWPRSITSRDTQQVGLPGAVYICTGKNFQGDCGWNQPSTECRIVGTGTQAPNSIGPDPGGFCELFDTADCSGQPLSTIRFPGSGEGFDGVVAGLRCSADLSRRTPAQAANVALHRDDRRLAGGVGSMERKRVKEQIEAMQKDGFSQGLIGLKKRMYY